MGKHLRIQAQENLMCPYAFTRGVLEFLRDDLRLALPPYRADPFPLRLADAVVERNFALVKELTR
jgi:hypothetical protein